MTASYHRSLLVSDLVKAVPADNQFTSVFISNKWDLDLFASQLQSFDFKKDQNGVFEILLSGIVRNLITESQPDNVVYQNKCMSICMMADYANAANLPINWQRVMEYLEPSMRDYRLNYAPRSPVISAFVQDILGYPDAQKLNEATGMSHADQAATALYLLAGRFDSFDINQAKTRDGVNLLMMSMAAMHSPVQLVSNLVSLGADIDATSEVYGPAYRFINFAEIINTLPNQLHALDKMQYMQQLGAPLFAPLRVKTYIKEEYTDHSILGIGDMFDSLYREYLTIEAVAGQIFQHSVHEKVSDFMAKSHNAYEAMQQVESLPVRTRNIL